MSLLSISPLDGRYEPQTQGMAAEFSEWALIRYRVQVEVEWLRLMAERPEIPAVRSLTDAENARLTALVTDFDEAEAGRVKEIEAVTRHDVKAIEYYLKEKLDGTGMDDVKEFVHFCCTSEDINNLAYGQMLRHGIQEQWLPLAEQLVARVSALAEATRALPMLARTHGQAASPTTLGKELAVFVRRWQRQLLQVRKADYLGKFSGAVGNYNAHLAVYPHAPWEEIARTLVTRLGLTHNPLTTQIEPHDYIAEIAHRLMRFNTITLGFDQDIWAYVSLGYFKQRVVAGEVGSSTMPHKVNPINFENSEANMGISTALLSHLALKLLVSRMQRDLTDSSTLRNLGTAVGHSVVALQSALRGVTGLEVNPDALRRDLEHAWEVLAEPIQTVMKAAGFADAYEQLKALTRGAGITQEALQAFVQTLDLPPDDKARLLAMTPETYIGMAPELVRHLYVPEG